LQILFADFYLQFTLAASRTWQVKSRPQTELSLQFTSAGPSL